MARSQMPLVSICKGAATRSVRIPMTSPRWRYHAPVRAAADPESSADEPVSPATAITGAVPLGSAAASAAVTTRVAAATEAAARRRGYASLRSSVRESLFTY